MKVRTRIILGFLLITAGGFYYLTNWILRDLRPHYLKSMEETLIDTATLLSSFVSIKVSDDTIATNELSATFDEAYRRKFTARVYDLVKERMNVRVYVTDREGTVIFDSDAGRDEGKDYSQWNDVYRTLRGDYGARVSRDVADDPRTSWLYVASPIKAGNRIIGSLTISKPEMSAELFIDHAKNKIITGGVIAGISVLLLGVALSSWVTRPITNLTAYARAVRDGGRPTSPKLGNSEIGTMGEAFEQMRDALEGKKYVEQYVQTLTHEIKSPLSAIGGAAELLDENMPIEKRKRFTENIKTEAARIRNVIDRLLQLSSLESRQTLKDVADIELNGLIRDVVESMQPLFVGKRIDVIVSLPHRLHAQGERFLLRQALANLLNNALEFTPEEGEIAISGKKESGSVVLTVEDSGPGIPNYALGRVFDRFYSLNRPDTNRKGTGLGLSFVREVASLHNGSVTMVNRPRGGARAVLVLNALASESPPTSA